MPELDRIRRDIGARLRIEHAVTEPAPESPIAHLKELATRVHDATREKLIAEVDAQVAELLRAAGRQPQDAHRPAGESADEFTPSNRHSTPPRYWIKAENRDIPPWSGLTRRSGA
jgi:hypothetical protein